VSREPSAEKTEKVEGERRGLIKKNIADCIDGLRRDAKKTEDGRLFADFSVDSRASIF